MRRHVKHDDEVFKYNVWKLELNPSQPNTKNQTTKMDIRWRVQWTFWTKSTLKWNAILSDAIQMAREHRQNAIQYLY